MYKQMQKKKFNKLNYSVFKFSMRDKTFFNYKKRPNFFHLQILENFDSHYDATGWHTQAYPNDRGGHAGNGHDFDSLNLPYFSYVKEKDRIFEQIRILDERPKESDKKNHYSLPHRFFGRALEITRSAVEIIPFIPQNDGIFEKLDENCFITLFQIQEAILGQQSALLRDIFFVLDINKPEPVFKKKTEKSKLDSFLEQKYDTRPKSLSIEEEMRSVSFDSEKVLRKKTKRKLQSLMQQQYNTLEKCLNIEEEIRSVWSDSKKTPKQQIKRQDLLIRRYLATFRKTAPSILKITELIERYFPPCAKKYKIALFAFKNQSETIYQVTFLIDRYLPYVK